MSWIIEHLSTILAAVSTFLSVAVVVAQFFHANAVADKLKELEQLIDDLLKKKS